MDYKETFNSEVVIGIKRYNKDVSSREIGGKAQSVLKLCKSNNTIPAGLILPVNHFDNFIIENNLRRRLNKLIKDQEFGKIKALICKGNLSSSLVFSINVYLDEKLPNAKRFIVRSSATVEDSKKHSFAGVFKTITNVSRDNIPSAIKIVYASMFSKKSFEYAKLANIKLSEFKMGIIIQEMIQTDYAGVAFTSGDHKVRIEYVKGLGEKLVEGKVNPHYIEFDRSKTYQDNNFVRKIANLALRIENAYGMPQDIEWGLRGRVVYIFQARPITAKLTSRGKITIRKGYKNLTGIPASQGIVTGTVRIINSLDELKSKLKNNDILVARTTPCSYYDDITSILKARGIVTQIGGVMTHEAILAREYRLPCVVGVNSATKILKDGSRVILDGGSGVIYYRGKTRSFSLPEEAQDLILESFERYSFSDGIIRKVSLDTFLRAPSRNFLSL